jgi:hypothetical protein
MPDRTDFPAVFRLFGPAGFAGFCQQIVSKLLSPAPKLA